MVLNDKIHASYKKNLGSKSLIYGEKGTILLNKSWSGGNIIIHLKRNSEQKISFANNKNIYSYQIEQISKNLIKGLNKINFPIMSLEETLINMKIIDNWLNYCESKLIDCITFFQENFIFKLRYKILKDVINEFISM